MADEILYNIKMSKRQEKAISRILAAFNTHLGTEAILIPNYILQESDEDYQMVDFVDACTVTIATDKDSGGESFLFDVLLEFEPSIFMVDVMVRDSLKEAVEEANTLIDGGVQAYYF